MSTTLPVNEHMCPSCPFSDTGWTHLRAMLQHRALNKGTPICHSTGSTALVPNKKRLSTRQRLCRGARDFQLMIFHRLGVIDAPTDAAWSAKREERGV